MEVRKLTGGKGATKPASAPTPKPVPAPRPAPKPAPRPNGRREAQALTVEDVGTIEASSIVVAPKETNALKKAAGSIKVPSFLQKATMPDLAAPETLGGYVGFADPNSKKWDLMQNAGLEHGDPFVFVDQQYHQCKPLEYFLLIGDSYRTTMEGQAGDFTFATRDLETPLRDIAEAVQGDTAKHKRLRSAILKAEPHYTCLILAKVGDTLVPVKADFRGTKSGAASSAILAVKSAEKPEWIGLSEAHKVTAAFPHPWGRVWNTVTTHYKVGKQSGNGFYVAKCTSKPANLSQMQMLVDHFNDEDFLAKLEEAEQSYNLRTEFLDNVGRAAEAGEEIDPATGQPKPF